MTATTLKTYYEEETFKNQVRLLNILLDTNEKLERIAVSIEKSNSNEQPINEGGNNE